MPRTLYAKLAAALLLLLAAMGLLYAVISVYTTQQYLREVNQQFNRDLASNLVADRNLVDDGQLNKDELKATFHHYMTINPSIEIYLLDADGGILAYSAEPGKVKRNRVSLEPIRAFLRNDDYPLLGDDPRDHGRQKAFSVTRVPSTGGADGYLYVVLRGEEFDSVNQAVIESHLFKLSALAVTGALLFGLLAGLLLFHLLTRRLRRLTSLMDGFRAGDFSSPDRYHVRDRSAADEIDQLGTTFNQMADRINSQLHSLTKKDELRRELVAHVSHDLRTPLASLRGYLETLQLKDETLTPGQRREYLDIALRHSERLSRLVMDLFELARLDAQETHVHEEPFGPAELVQDVVQKFQLQAEQRGVNLCVEGAGPIPLVRGEISLIERVLENLIENSLQHTPEGGQARVSVNEHGDEVEFTVEDTGPGIPESDLPRIFDRFFQVGDKHRGGIHAGLGLAIAKRILELHGRAITVDSEMDVGTRFHFCLPVGQVAAHGHA